MRPCLERGCPELVERGRRRCSAHELEQDVRWVYADPRWQPSRLECFARDRFRCSCGFTGTARTLHAHHVPRLRMLLALGRDPFDVDHIETKCGPCHSRLTATGQ